MAPSGMARVRLIVFDFDQTLSVIHVFKTLAGWPTSNQSIQLPQPFAQTERGQLRRIDELDRTGAFRNRRFAEVAFGSQERVEQLRHLLCTLKERDVELVICTKGLVGTARKCLDHVGLLEYFAEVFGNVGCNYGKTQYDEEAASLALTEDEQRYVGSAKLTAWGSKDKLISKLKSRRGLTRSQVLFVEDDAQEVRRCGAVCQPLWVKDAAGMTLEHIETLLELTSDSPDSREGNLSRSKSGSGASDSDRISPGISWKESQVAASHLPDDEGRLGGLKSRFAGSCCKRRGMSTSAVPRLPHSRDANLMLEKGPRPQDVSSMLEKGPRSQDGMLMHERESRAPAGGASASTSALRAAGSAMLGRNMARSSR